MRLVVQRVKRARVLEHETGQKVGEIKKGLFVLVGFAKEDSEKDVVKIANKLAGLRVMSDKEGKMNLSVKDIDTQILLVSQFTLISDSSSGNRPSFINAMDSIPAIKYYELLVSEVRNHGIKVETGSFGKYMSIDLELDGPVTIILDA